MKTIADALFEQIWNTLWAPQLLPETFTFEGETYSIGYEHTHDGDRLVSVRFFAFLENKKMATLELKPLG